MPANQLRSNDQSVWFIASLVYVSVCSYIFIAALPEYSDSNRFYACTLFVFCTFPLIRHIVRDDATVPILEIPLASYAVYYCLPLLYQSEHAVYATTIVPSPKHIDRTLIGVILGVVGMISGYVAAKSFNLLSIIPKITVPEFRSGPLARVALSIIAASFLFQLLIGSAPAGTERIVAVLLSQDVAIALLGILYYTNCLSKGYTALAICLLIALTFKGLVSGSTQTALQPLFVWALTGWITRKQFPYKMALLGIVAALITQPVKKQYRQQVWFGKSSQSTAIERFELYVKIGLDHWVRNKDMRGSAISDQIEKSAAERFSLLLHSQRYFQLTPEKIPYKNGESVGYLFYGWIPRVLWPGKPGAQIANRKYPVEYGIQHPASVKKSSFGIGHTTEAYVNFGLAGIFPLFMLLGALVRLPIDILKTRSTNNPVARSIQCFATINLMFVGSTIGNAYGSLVTGLIAQAILLRFLARNL